MNHYLVNFLAISFNTIKLSLKFLLQAFGGAEQNPTTRSYFTIVDLGCGVCPWIRLYRMQGRSVSFKEYQEFSYRLTYPFLKGGDGVRQTYFIQTLKKRLNSFHSSSIQALLFGNSKKFKSFSPKSSF